MIWCDCCLGGTNLVTACLDSRSFYSRHRLERCRPRSGRPRLSRSTLRYLHIANLNVTYLSILKISTGEVTLTRRKLPMIQIYIPHNLPILCNILDGRKQILSVSQWYVRIPVFGTRLIIKISGWCHCCGIHFTLSPPCWRRRGTYRVSGTFGGAFICRFFAFYYGPHVTTWTV